MLHTVKRRIRINNIKKFNAIRLKKRTLKNANTCEVALKLSIQKDGGFVVTGGLYDYGLNQINQIRNALIPYKYKNNEEGC